MGILLSVAGGSDSASEINEACQFSTDAAHPDSKFIFGTVIDDALGDEVRITVIAAGFEGGAPKAIERPVITTNEIAGQADHGNRKRPSSGCHGSYGRNTSSSYLI
jgi:cell division protein FtsZ